MFSRNRAKTHNAISNSKKQKMKPDQITQYRMANIINYKNNKNNRLGHVLYNVLEPGAKSIKIFLQICIGILLTLTLITKLVFHFFNLGYDGFPFLTYLEFLHSLSTLLIVSKALEYSAGIELAYMLFTPGPDEAISPLVTSAAAGLMHAIANEGKLDVQIVFSMLLYVIVIAFLFMIKEIFTKDEEVGEKRRLIDYLKDKFKPAN